MKQYGFFLQFHCPAAAREEEAHHRPRGATSATDAAGPPPFPRSFSLILSNGRGANDVPQPQQGVIDLVNADKDNYHRLLIDLVKIGGVIGSDNTLWNGTVAAPADAPMRKYICYYTTLGSSSTKPSPPTTASRSASFPS
ncbi:hypothetical protein KSP40_PGU017506 [Platanthera guangdongensis]|uniref:norbelladine O-methyltransferase n=1 Tax=Platanthera guangdongensis TaxID=2320717 RepID=A0ABR2LFZ5_9ASPA